MEPNAQKNNSVVAGQQDPPEPAPAAEPANPLPEDTRDRTKQQFDKLLESNQRLYDANNALRKEMEAKKVVTSVLPPTDLPPVNAQQPTVNTNDFIERDPVSGEQYINEKKLKSRIEEIQNKASKAEDAVNKYIKSAEDREVDRQNTEAFNTYPELNPRVSDKFNNSFHKQVRGVLYDSMINADDYGGRALTFKEAADFVKEQGGSSVKTEKSETGDVQSQKSQQGKENDPPKKGDSLKEQTSAQAISQPQNQPAESDSAEMEELRMKTRYGDDNALARRLLHTPHIVEGETT